MYNVHTIKAIGFAQIQVTLLQNAILAHFVQ
jgi:hypothetical protein